MPPLEAREYQYRSWHTEAVAAVSAAYLVSPLERLDWNLRIDCPLSAYPLAFEFSPDSTTRLISLPLSVPHRMLELRKRSVREVLELPSHAEAYSTYQVLHAFIMFYL